MNDQPPTADQDNTTPLGAENTRIMPITTRAILWQLAKELHNIASELHTISLTLTEMKKELK